MPGDVGMTYPFPYKTADGLLEDSDSVVTPTVYTEDVIITQGTTPVFEITSGVGPSRGIIRTLDDAFNCDITVQGTGKYIKLSTDDVQRLLVQDTQVSIDSSCTLNMSNDIVLGNNKSIIFIGSSSGSVTLKPNTTGSAWNFVLPSSAGALNAVLTSGAGSTCTWTASTGTGSNVLATSPTLVTPILGVATATTLTTGTLIGSGTTSTAGDSLLIGPSGQDNLFIDRNFNGGNFIWGFNTTKVAGEHYIQQFYNNKTDRNLLLAVISKGTSTGTDRVLVNCPLITSNPGTLQHQSYPQSTGPASIQLQTNSAGSVQFETGVCSASAQFSSSSVAGDTVLKNATGGRILMQSGSGAANLIMSASTLTFNGANLLLGAVTQGSWTPTFNLVAGSTGSPSITTAGRYVKSGAAVTITFFASFVWSSAATPNFSFFLTNLPYETNTLVPTSMVAGWTHNMPSGGFADSGGTTVTPLWELANDAIDSIRLVYYANGSGTQNGYFKSSSGTGNMTVWGAVTYICFEL